MTSAGRAPISANDSVRDVVRRYPGIESVFDRFGLAGCGGPSGPLEPVGFFAAVHHVDVARLLGELAAYADARDHPVQAPRPQDRTYRWFTSVSLAFSLFAGLIIGIVAILDNAAGGSLGGRWVSWVQAHGQAQLVGFVELFILGIGFHVMPRFKAQEPLPARPRLAVGALLAAGVAARLVAPLLPSPIAAAFVGVGALAIAGGGVAAGVAFGYHLWRARDRREFYDPIIGAAAAWFVISGVISAVGGLRAWANGAPAVRPDWDEALVISQLLGVAMTMAWGVTARTVPFFLNLRQPHERTVLGSAALEQLAVAALVAAPLVGGGTAQALRMTGAAALAVAVAGFVFGVRLAEPEEKRADADRAREHTRFVKLAYIWLAVAALLQLAWFIVERGGIVPMWPAGAIRHAFAVGFITTLIIGMSYRTVPVFSGHELRHLGLVRASFWLLFAAAALRVLPVGVTDAPPAFARVLVGVAGISLWAALAAFAIVLAALRRSVDASQAAQAAPEAAPTTQEPPGAHEPADLRAWAAPERTVEETLERFPTSLARFLDLGFATLAEPAMRRAMAPCTTLAQAAAIRGLGYEQLLDQLAPTPAATAGDEDDGSVSVELVRIALKSVHDPEIPVNVVDLGLIYGIRVERGKVAVRMTLTSPFCPVADQVVRDAEEAVYQVPGVASVDIEVVYDPPWDPERMTDDGKRQLGWASAPA